MNDDCTARQRRRSSRTRESYDEIAELEAELRRAYTAKELRAQFVERETERYIEKVRNQHAAKLMRLEERAAMEEDLRQRSEIRQNTEDYRRQLTGQMTRKQEERGVMMEEARREREILTEVDRMREQCEKFRAFKAKNELADSIRRERLIVQEMKIIRCQEEMEAETRKFIEDKEYLQEIERRTIEAKEFRKEQARNRERAIREIAKILMDVNSRKEEREMVIVELMAEDVKRELLIKEQESMTRRKKLRDQLAADLEEQIVFTEQCKVRFVEQDRAFAEEIMRMIAEDERTARLTAEARRRVQLQYREDLVRLIETRKRIREDEVARMEEIAEKRNERERINLERVREERKRLLEKHASNVIDFLDKSILTEEEEDIVARTLE
ncbi:Meiosis-specific nuclear structural protein 1 [Dufourea novaeangliae]|uniref:Meiosis-specific nuclear structural protein 1 n=2 Tax=Dufourea novaeangliae TaxID=178035 RepID=A0A154P8B3_DUFNO|nr:Meiosis-specific nuclear structural protein 1 [Dufourea novaeangliae]